MCRVEQITRRVALSALVIALALLANSLANAQVQIADMRPDAGAPGMTIALELLAPASLTNNFGSDGIAPTGTSIVFENPQDTNRVIVGPIVTSWNGRLMQVPFIILPNASIGPLAFHVRVGNRVSTSDTFSIVRASAPISIFGGALLGTGPFAGGITRGNTIVVQSIALSGSLGSGAVYSFSTQDSSGQANPRYLPITVLSAGPITIDGAQLSLDADSNLNGGPGGGGGGHGNSGTGGAGYTGGGSDSLASFDNVGSGGTPTDTAGGSSVTGVIGGGTDSQEDQGGGGGTGAPFGLSGKSGAKSDTSRAGGFGGGSAGGELGQVKAYGGGGGGFGTAGENGGGIGANGGRVNGGRFLVPLAGGSGGGAGNALNQVPTAGSGGGGGGAVAIVGYSTMTLKNSLISANGADGSAGKNIAAGGGGGSGGGILLSVRRAVTETDSRISATGGTAGAGGAVEFGGGAGGLGRIRVDGRSFGCSQCSESGVSSAGPSIDPIDTIITHSAVRITGYSEDSLGLTDSLRIYYRTRRSNWQFIGTLRTIQSGHRLWNVTLPELHDSVIFAVVFAKVNTPRVSLYDQDPPWLLSHISIGRFVHRPLPFVKAGADSIDFGCVKLGACKVASLPVSSLSEIAARIDSVVILDGLNFSSLSTTPRNLVSFLADSLKVQFCPSHAGAFRTTLKIFSNDTTRVVTLGACGLPHDDSITIFPRSLNFGRVPLGQCDTLHFTITAVGKDTSIVHFAKLLPPPFTWDALSDSLILPPGNSHQFILTFCPSDTGNVRRSIAISSDSLVLTGYGIQRKLSFSDTLDLGSVCLGSCSERSIELRNIGNDTTKITQIRFADSTLRFAPDVPVRILRGDSLSLSITACPKAVGPFTSNWTLSTNDSIYHLTVVGRVSSIVVSFVPLDLGILCADSLVSRQITLHDLSLDTIRILNAALSNANAFTIQHQPEPRVLALNDSSVTRIQFSSSSVGIFNDTLLIHLQNGACDSMLRVPIKAIATKEPVAFTHSILNFGALPVDSCFTDSTVIANPCGPAVTLIPIRPTGPFSLLDPATTFVLPSGSSRRIVYRYCPITPGNDSASVGFVQGLDTFQVKLLGIGTKVPPAQRAVFRISREVMSAGFTQSITVSLDSIVSLQQLASVSGTLNYDPTVLLPQSASPTGSLSLVSAESAPGKFDFQLTGSIMQGPLFHLHVLPLLATTDTTVVDMTNLIISPSIADTAINGGVRIVDCGNLAGHVAIAGDYVLHALTPNPSSNAIRVTFELGAAGPVQLSIMNETGARVSSPVKGEMFSSGLHTIDLDLSQLSSGFHELEIESNGWRVRRPFLICK